MCKCPVISSLFDILEPWKVTEFFYDASNKNKTKAVILNMMVEQVVNELGLIIYNITKGVKQPEDLEGLVFSLKSKATRAAKLLKRIVEDHAMLSFEELAFLIDMSIGLLKERTDYNYHSIFMTFYGINTEVESLGSRAPLEAVSLIREIFLNLKTNSILYKVLYLLDCQICWDNKKDLKYKLMDYDHNTVLNHLASLIPKRLILFEEMNHFKVVYGLTVYPGVIGLNVKCFEGLSIKRAKALVFFVLLHELCHAKTDKYGHQGNSFRSTPLYLEITGSYYKSSKAPQSDAGLLVEVLTISTSLFEFVLKNVHKFSTDELMAILKLDLYTGKDFDELKSILGEYKTKYESSEVSSLGGYSNESAKSTTIERVTVQPFIPTIIPDDNNSLYKYLKNKCTYILEHELVFYMNLFNDIGIKSEEDIFTKEGITDQNLEAIEKRVAESGCSTMTSRVLYLNTILRILKGEVS
jgi:hypothetical protein